MEFVIETIVNGSLGGCPESEQVLFQIAGEVMKYTKPELNYHGGLGGLTFSVHGGTNAHEDSTAGASRGRSL